MPIAPPLRSVVRKAPNVADRRPCAGLRKFGNNSMSLEHLCKTVSIESGIGVLKPCYIIINPYPMFTILTILSYCNDCFGFCIEYDTCSAHSQPDTGKRFLSISCIGSLITVINLSILSS